MSNIFKEIKLIAEELEHGDNTYTDCPLCGGTNKFSILRQDNEAIYHCFRESCGLSKGGKVGLNGSKLVYTSTRKVAKATPFTSECFGLTDIQSRFLKRKVGFDQEHMRMASVAYAPVEDRFVYPIFEARTRTIKGHVLRSYSGGTPKAIINLNNAGYTKLSWYSCRDPGKRKGWLVVVEDIPSAVRMARYCDAVALNGTGVGPAAMEELSNNTRKIVWALDPDATATALRLDRQFSHVFQNSFTLVLQQDIKDMVEAYLQSICEEYF
jgi:hypothetical protein